MENSNIKKGLYALKILSLKVAEPLWPFLGIYVVPTPEIKDILENGIKEILEYAQSNGNYPVFLQNQYDKIFTQLNTLKQAHVVPVGDALKAWIELEFIPTLDSKETEPWKKVWRGIIYRIGNKDWQQKRSRPEFLDKKSFHFFALAEDLYYRENLLGRQWADVDGQPWVGWDKTINEDFYSFVDQDEDPGIDRESSFGSSLLDLDTYMQLKNFSEIWYKISSFLNQEELKRLNDWGMEDLKHTSWSSMLEENKEEFLKEYSIPDIF